MRYLRGGPEGGAGVGRDAEQPAAGGELPLEGGPRGGLGRLARLGVPDLHTYRKREREEREGSDEVWVRTTGGLVTFFLRCSLLHSSCCTMSTSKIAITCHRRAGEKRVKKGGEGRKPGQAPQ